MSNWLGLIWKHSASVSTVLKRTFELLFSIRHKVFRLIPVSSAKLTKDI